MPPARSSARPSRAETSSVASSCAASPGQTCVLSHGRSGRSSGPFRSSVWQRWTCVWTNPGRSQRPRASRRSSGRPAACDLARAALRVAVESRDHAVLDEDVPAGRHVRGLRHPDDERVLDEKGSHRGIICLLRQDRPFVREQPALARDAAAVAGELSVRADDAVARHDDRDGIRAVRGRDGADGGRPADRARELRVRPASCRRGCCRRARQTFSWNGVPSVSTSSASRAPRSPAK